MVNFAELHTRGSCIHSKPPSRNLSTTELSEGLVDAFGDQYWDKPLAKPFSNYFNEVQSFEVAAPKAKWTAQNAMWGKDDGGWHYPGGTITYFSPTRYKANKGLAATGCNKISFDTSKLHGRGWEAAKRPTSPL
ncbi:hypothetical protein DFH09DRAFT_1086380 [Mycena vulgaris]|nr:hypothetical protein DFH09DRAFT_1086380 [Mycena vulgaris]